MVCPALCSKCSTNLAACALIIGSISLNVAGAKDGLNVFRLLECSRGSRRLNKVAGPGKKS